MIQNYCRRELKLEKINLKLCAIILLIILLSLVSFLGIYQKKLNKYVNILPEYKLGTEFVGERVIKTEVSVGTKTVYYDAEGNLLDESHEHEHEHAEGEEHSDEENLHEGETTEEVPINVPEILTKDNYNLTKQIITKRLKNSGIREYTIRQDDSGNITVNVPENQLTDYVAELLSIKR